VSTKAVAKFLASPESEENLLACIFQNPRIMARVVDILKADDFYRDRHRVLYQIMTDLYQKGRRCSVETVWSEIERQNRLEEMGDLRDTDLFLWSNRLATLQPIQEYVSIITHYATMRRLSHVAAQIAAMAYAEEDGAVEQAEKLIYSVAMGTGTRPVTTLAEALDDYIEDLEQRIEDKQQGIARGIPTGFKDLDHTIGGMQPGTLYTLGALTGLGKSSWALNLTMNVVQHAKHALFFSLEMKVSELVQRILSGEALIDQTFLRDADIDKIQFQMIKTKAEGIRKCALEIDDTSYLLSDIKSKIRQIHARKPLNLVVIDYLQLVKVSVEGRDRHETRTEELGTLSREMKRLAHELDIPIVVLVQLNRNVEHRQSKEPTLADINESGAIARDSDVVMFLYTTPPSEDQQENPLQNGMYPVYLKIAKNRNGGTGEVTLLFCPRITRFKDLKEPGREEFDHED
jgi:replicative DNA helicase